jgi:penicillin-binding protein 1C
VETWYIPGRSPIHVSQLHRAVALDPRSGMPVCPPYAADTRFEVFEFWSSDMLRLFRQAGMPRRTPPELPGCVTRDGSGEPRISSPLRSVTYALRRSRTDGIALDAESAADVRQLFWFDGGALIGSYAAAGDATLSWRPTAPGLHVIRVVDDHGRAAERDVDVRFTN